MMGRRNPLGISGRKMLSKRKDRVCRDGETFRGIVKVDRRLLEWSEVGPSLTNLEP